MSKSVASVDYQTEEKGNVGRESCLIIQDSYRFGHSFRIYVISSCFTLFQPLSARFNYSSSYGIFPPSAICTFRNTTYTISRFPHNVTCQVTRIPHRSHCPTLWLAASWQGKGKAVDATLPPTGARSSSTQEGAATLSPIFLPQGPPSRK